MLADIALEVIENRNLVPLTQPLQPTQATSSAPASAAQRPRPDATQLGRPPTLTRTPWRTHPRIRGRLNLRTLRARAL
jgi:hypothetical protein